MEEVRELGMLDLTAESVTLDKLEVSEVVLPLVTAFRSAIGIRTERRALFVRWFDERGNWGIGECSCRPDPFYSGEFVAGAKLVIEHFMQPLMSREQTIAGVLGQLARTRGWPFTAAAVEDAMWDCRRRLGLPDLVDHWSGPRIRSIPVGISLGIFDATEDAIANIRSALDVGYRRIKLKISPATEFALMREIRRTFPAAALAFDANGSFGCNDFDLLIRLSELEPVAIEQPFPPGRLDLSRQLKQRVPSVHLCLDESITDLGVAITAWQLGACDEINIKPGRLGGQAKSLEVLRFCDREGIPAWVGGMFETGVGRISNLRMASLLPTAKAHDLSPSDRYFQRDVLEDPLTMHSGAIDIGRARPLSLDEDTIDELTVHTSTYEIRQCSIS